MPLLFRHGKGRRGIKVTRLRACSFHAGTVVTQLSLDLIGIQEYIFFEACCAALMFDLSSFHAWAMSPWPMHQRRCFFFGPCQANRHSSGYGMLKNVFLRKKETSNSNKQCLSYRKMQLFQEIFGATIYHARNVEKYSGPIQFLKNFTQYPSHRIFRHMHGALNAVEKNN